jgi:YD repeat-containing protein
MPINFLRFLFISYLLFQSGSILAQVDLPTGKAQLSLPLFNYNNNDRLATSVSLVYTDGAGVKVNKMASDVGLGWELSCGGVITRITKGEPDDQKGGTYNNELYADGNLYRPNYGRERTMPFGTAFVPLLDHTVEYFKYNEEVIADRRQDEFIFQFGNKTGKFMIDVLGNITILDSSMIKIEKVIEDMSGSKILTRISKFIITDESGVKYTFSEKELGKIISYQTKGRRQFFLETTPANLRTYMSKQQYKISDYFAVNAWYLSEINDPFTGRKIKFTYDSYNVEYVSDIDAVIGTTRADDSQDEIVTLKVDSRTASTLKRVAQIEMPNNTKVKFSYSNTNRVDLPGANALTKISIESDGIENLGYLFNYQYFSRTNLRDFNYVFPAAELTNARLCLKSVQKYGRDNLLDKPIQFTYNNSYPGVPGRCNGGVDHWGYFNGTEFELWDTDLKTYNNLQTIARANRRAFGMTSGIQLGTLSSIKYPNGGTMQYIYENNTAFNGTKDIQTGGLRVKKVIWNEGLNANPDIVKEYKYIREDGKSSGWGYEEPSYNYSSSTHLVVPVKGSFMLSTISTVIGSGGPEFALIMTAVTFILSELYLPTEIERDILTDNTSSLSGKRLKPLPRVYSSVTEYEGTVAENRGKSVFDFTTDKDFPIQYPMDPQLGRQRYVPGLYGLLKRKRVYNKQNEIVKDLYNRYEAFVGELKGSLHYSVDFTPTRTLVTPWSYLSQYYNLVGAMVDVYYPIAGRPQLTYSVERNFTDNSNFNEISTDYVYDKNHNLKTEITKSSLGETIERRAYYTYDYNIPGVFKTLKDSAVTSMPVSSESWLIADGKEDRLIGLEVANLALLGNGAIKPDKIYRLVSKVPISKSVIGEFDPTTLVRNITLIKEQENMVYNASGDLIETIVDSRLESNIYDDKGETIIAKVLNAAPQDIAFSSFEKGAKGNWSIVPKGTDEYLSTISSLTGSSCLNLVAINTIQKTGLSSSKKYYLSYWIQGGSVTITGGNKENETAGVIRNGWTYKTLIVSQTSSITITGTGYLDELRLLPVDAAMTSHTYNDFRTISSTTNPAGITSYYEYDGLGRVKLQKDADKNIIKSYNYQYKGNL